MGSANAQKLITAYKMKDCAIPIFISVKTMMNVDKIVIELVLIEMTETKSQLSK